MKEELSTAWLSIHLPSNGWYSVRIFAEDTLPFHNFKRSSHLNAPKSVLIYMVFSKFKENLLFSDCEPLPPPLFPMIWGHILWYLKINIRNKQSTTFSELYCENRKLRKRTKHLSCLFTRNCSRCPINNRRHFSHRRIPATKWNLWNLKIIFFMVSGIDFNIGDLKSIFIVHNIRVNSYHQ